MNLGMISINLTCKKISDRFGIKYKSKIYLKSNQMEDHISMGDTVDSIDSSSKKFNQPITIRKEFPETWIWDNIIESGFVIKF